jgi:hypothetical protein
MRRLLLGALVCVVLVLTVAADGAGPENAAPEAAKSAPPPSAGALISHVIPDDTGSKVVVIDGSQRVMAVYHVDKTSGAITLSSVRNLTWDLQMMQYNSGKPLPQEIRDMRGELQR